jgi:hypothetical protein
MTFNTKPSIYLICLIIATVFSCGTVKRAYLQDLTKEDTFVFQNKDFALLANGIGTVKVYNGRIAVKIKQGSIKLNPKYDHDSFAVGAISVGLGKYYAGKKWHIVNQSKYRRIKKTLHSSTDEITLRDVEFEIPYTDPKELTNMWLVFKLLDASYKGAIYSFAIQ